MKTLPSIVDNVVQDYIAQLNRTNPKSIVGIYLTGSVPPGDYYTNKSAIDFFTVTNDEPTQYLLHQLKYIQQSIKRKHHHPKLNGCYLTTTGLLTANLRFLPSTEIKCIRKDRLSARTLLCLNQRFFPAVFTEDRYKNFPSTCNLKTY